MGIAALVLGIVGLLASLNPWLIFVSAPLGIIAVILGVLGRKAAQRDHLPTGSATAGMALGIVALAVAVLMWVVCTMVVKSVGSSIEKNIGEPFKKAMAEAKAEEEREAKGLLVLDKAGAVKTSATELVAAYEVNPFNADQRFKDKTLRISGTVDKVSSTLDNRASIGIASGDHKVDEWGGVECRLTTAESAKAATLKKGDKVTCVGLFRGRVMSFLLRGAVLE